MAKAKRQNDNGPFMSDNDTLAERIREVEKYGARPIDQRVAIANHMALLASKVELSDPAYSRRVFSGLLHGSMVPEDVFPIVKTDWPAITKALGLPATR